MRNGSTTWTYTYDANGMRIGRTNGTKTYSYLYTNGLLSRMIIGDDTLCFAYDAVGAPLTVNYNGTTFYYVTNLQGDVIAILDSYGNAVAEYTYNAWGELLTTVGSTTTDLSTINPLLYRGYVYDRETKLYYLQSRYYNPEIGRFISADNYPSTGQGLTGNNMFAYCGNNPVARADKGGEFWEAIAIGFVAGMIGQYVSDVITNVKEGKRGVAALEARSSITDYLASGVGGAIAAIPGLNLFGTMAVGALGNVATGFLKGDITSWDEAKDAAFIGAVANGVGYGVAKGMAALKVKQINNMPRTARKQYLKTKIFNNTQASANNNLYNFSTSPLRWQIKLVEQQLSVFRSGIYSTITSTTGTVIVGT